MKGGNIMQNLSLNNIRERFIRFFESKGHLALPSFKLIPQHDASLLLINSGMAPLKPYFTGKEEPPCKRIITCQKCIRTPDIENVGKTSRHGTFFEMLGNFSFGDYFKKEATAWAWEFITADLKLPVDRLWISVYEQDDEAFEIWTNQVKVPADRIVMLGKKDNFWEIGLGPCGPCSEIYFDRGEDKGCGSIDCKVGCDCDRYVEFWNLVFTQFNKGENSEYTRLKNPNIDTGMGLERLACIMQDVDNIFEVDTIRNVLNNVCQIAGIKYGESKNKDISIRVITDHIRSTVMMICDGVIPSNEGRGYVLRRLLRRAARHGKLLSIDKPFLYTLVNIVINESKKAYKELEQREDYIKKVIKAEEDKFEITIDQGMVILNNFISSIKNENKNIIPGSMVFKLHDTYGFPLDLTREIVVENGLEIDEEGFIKKMNEQKQKAREAFKNKVCVGWNEDNYSVLKNIANTLFVGYTELKINATVQYILKDCNEAKNAEEGDLVVIILDKTPFYAESGGQVGDTGFIISETGKIQVTDCRKTGTGKYLHIGFVLEGVIEVNSGCLAKVDSVKRSAIERNHTATHLLHKALRSALGDHVNQAGSMVDDSKLRFDFSHFAQISSEDLKQIQDQVIEKITENISVDIKEMPIQEARILGATALFGEKYGDIVRVVKIGNYSTELCGGTHIGSTSQIQLFKIISESGIAAGVRRIEALTGEAVIRYYIDKESAVQDISSLIKCNPTDCLKKLESILLDLKNYKKENEELKTILINKSLDDVLNKKITIEGVNVLCACFDKFDLDTLRKIGDILKNKLGSGVIVLASAYQEKVGFIATATKDAVQKGINSGNIIKEAAKVAGGRGGGRPDMAQAEAKDVTQIDAALKKAKDLIKEQLKTCLET